MNAQCVNTYPICKSICVWIYIYEVSSLQQKKYSEYFLCMNYYNLIKNMFRRTKNNTRNSCKLANFTKFAGAMTFNPTLTWKVINFDNCPIMNKADMEFVTAPKILSVWNLIFLRQNCLLKNFLLDALLCFVAFLYFYWVQSS